MAGNPKNQAEQRTELDILDQHGRQWHTCIEDRTGGTTGGYNRCGWNDPLRHTANYLEMVKGRVMGSLWTLSVLWDKWINQTVQDEETWYGDLIRIASDKYSVLDPDKVPFLENDPIIRRLAGPKPWPSSSVLRAARDGDKQYLGLDELDAVHRKALGLSTMTDIQRKEIADSPAFVSAIPSEQAKASVPPPPDRYQDFVSWAMTHVPDCKGDLGRVAVLWKEHRENLIAAEAA